MRHRRHRGSHLNPRWLGAAAGAILAGIVVGRLRGRKNTHQVVPNDQGPSVGITRSTGPGAVKSYPGTVADMTDRRPTQTFRTTLTVVEVWVNSDTRVTMHVRENDGRVEVSDITDRLAAIVAIGADCAAGYGHTSNRDGDVLDSEGIAGEADEPGTVELGWINLDGTVRVHVNGKRLTEEAVLARCAAGIKEAIRGAVANYDLPAADQGAEGNGPKTGKKNKKDKGSKAGKSKKSDKKAKGNR